MKQHILIILLSSLLLAGCGGNNESSSFSSDVSKASSSIEETQEVLTDDGLLSSEQASEDTAEETSLTIESSASEETSATSEEEMYVGDWLIDSTFVRSSSKNYPAPYYVDVDSSTGASVRLDFVDVMSGQGKFEGTYIQMKKETGLICSETYMSGTLTLLLLENFVSCYVVTRVNRHF